MQKKIFSRRLGIKVLKNEENHLDKINGIISELD